MDGSLGALKEVRCHRRSPASREDIAEAGRKRHKTAELLGQSVGRGLPEFMKVDGLKDFRPVVVAALNLELEDDHLHW